MQGNENFLTSLEIFSVSKNELSFPSISSPLKYQRCVSYRKDYFLYRVCDIFTFFVIFDKNF